MRWSAAWWAYWSGVGAVGLTAAAAMAGLVAWYFSNRAAAENDARTAALELSIAEQRERAAIAERRLLELQERARPRTVDDSARAAIIDWLGAAKPEGPIAIQFVSGSTTEPADFARALREIIATAGWNVTSVTGGPAMGRPPLGLKVAFNEDEPPQRAIVLQHALERGKLPTQLERRPDVKPGEVQLVVGLKP